MTRDIPIVPLSDVAFFQEGPGLRNWQWTTDGMKVINVTNILGDAAGAVDVSNTDKFISLVEFEVRYQHFAVENRDIVVASSGNTYGKVGRISDRCLPLMMNTSVIRFHSLDTHKLDDDYLYSFLRSPAFRNQVEQFVIGGAQPNFGPSHLKKMAIPLPDITTQRRIGEFISAYDTLLENNQRRIQLLEQAARLLYKEWFVHLRYPGHEHVKIKDGVPEGWESACIAEIGEVITGKTPSKKNDSYYGGDVPFIKTPDMHGNSVVIQSEESLSEKGANSQSNKTLPPRSILVSCIGTVGAVAFNGSTAQTNQQINAIVPKDDSLRYWTFFMVKGLKGLLEGMSGGATMPNVNKSKFSNIKVTIPSPLMLEQFASVVAPQIDQIEKLTLMNSRLAKARDLLLPRLMNGELVA